MPNQSLVDLTERTATADTDLIHVNSGGTDYKETKANFLSDVNSSITSLNNSLTNNFVTQEFTKSGSKSSNTDYYDNITITKSGYTPIGIIQWLFGGDYSTRFFLNGATVNATTAYLVYRAESTTSFTSNNFSVKIVVLYKKNT